MDIQQTYHALDICMHDMHCSHGKQYNWHTTTKITPSPFCSRTTQHLPLCLQHNRPRARFLPTPNSGVSVPVTFSACFSCLVPVSCHPPLYLWAATPTSCPIQRPPPQPCPLLLQALNIHGTGSGLSIHPVCSVISEPGVHVGEVVDHIQVLSCCKMQPGSW